MTDTKRRPSTTKEDRAVRPSRGPARTGRVGDGSLAASLQAASHARTRKAHATELAEDYVEVIAELIDTAGEARVVDIARRLGVSHVTVVRTVARLVKSGLVTAKPYRAIFLTAAGEKLAAHSRKRHETVLKFLLSLGIPAAVAQADAEGIEHHVSKETLAAFERHTKSGK